MKPVLLTAILVTVSPLALAQQGMDASPAETSAVQARAPLPAAIERGLSAGALEATLPGAASEDIIKGARLAYEENGFEPLWTRRGAASLQKAASNLYDYGLTDEARLTADLGALTDQRFRATDETDRAEADLALTGAWLRLASAAGSKLSDTDSDKGTGESGTPPLAQAKLARHLIAAGRGDADTALHGLEPDAPQYAALKGALQTYRGIREAGGWMAIPEGDTIEEGESDPRIPAIRERLTMEGYDAERSIFTLVNEAMAAGETEETAPGEPAAASTERPAADVEAARKALDPLRYDKTLADAVKTFQSRHGIKVDGVVGPSTLSAMNESVESKITRIAGAMERWRELGPLDEPYIIANIPSYTAEGWKDGKREISMKTVVGMASRETPAFSDEVEYVVANPRWYAPVSIVRRDKLPKLQEDPGYAERGNYRIYDRATGKEVSAWSVDWRDPASAENYRMVQMSGSSNALGELKIIFPNRHAIYLHGTPGEHLFERDERAFSSGCIRLERPQEMATWIAGLDSATEAENLRKAVASSARQRFELKTRIPIHITYMTVTVGEDATVNFWRDIYNRTEGIEMAEKTAPLAESESSTPAGGLASG